MSTFIYGAQAPRIPTSGGVTVPQPDPGLKVIAGLNFVSFNFVNEGLVVTAVGDVTNDNGAITALQYIFDGQIALTIQNFTIPFSQLDTLIDDGDALLDRLTGGADSFLGGVDGDSISGGAGNDTVIALDGNDLINGGAGNDDLNGNKGNDFVYGGEGADTVRGGQGNDYVLGSSGDDPHVNGNLGDDVVDGMAGDDTVYGGQGDDSVSGGEGDDLVSGDLGLDTLVGNSGADRFRFVAGGGHDWILDFTGKEGDLIVLAAGQSYSIARVGLNTVISLGGGDDITLAGAVISDAWITFG